MEEERRRGVLRWLLRRHPELASWFRTHAPASRDPEHQRLFARVLRSVIYLTECVHRAEGRFAQMPLLRRQYRQLLFVALSYTTVARLTRTPVEFRIGVQIQERYRTRRSEPGARLAVRIRRAVLEVRFPEERVGAFRGVGRIVRGYLPTDRPFFVP